MEHYYAVMDTGSLNDAMLGYCDLATYRAGLDEDTRKKVRRELYFLFDEYTAKEAHAVYTDGIPDHEVKRRQRRGLETFKDDD